MSDVKSGKGKKKEVFSDHKRVGKRFIPPLLQLTTFQDLSWVDCTLPELLWLGLLNDQYGLKKGANLGLSLAKTAAAATEKKVKRWYALTSAYSLLTEQEKNKVIVALKTTSEHDALKLGLVQLVALYPECPLSFLFEGQVPVIEDIEETPRYIQGVSPFLLL